MKEKVGHSERLIKALFFKDECLDGLKGCTCYDVRERKSSKTSKLFLLNPFHHLIKLFKSSVRLNK